MLRAVGKTVESQEVDQQGTTGFKVKAREKDFVLSYRCAHLESHSVDPLEGWMDAKLKETTVSRDEFSSRL